MKRGRARSILILILSIMILSFTTGAILGCNGRDPAPRHSVDDITVVSISYGCMDRSLSYSFCIHRADGGWLFDAECFVDGYEREVTVTDLPLDPEDIDELFEVLEASQAVLSAAKAKSTKQRARASDGDSYSFCITFSDGETSVTSKRQTALEAFCYRLAEVYGEASN